MPVPVIKSAIKKLRKDIKREKNNDLFREKLSRALKSAKKLKSSKNVKEASSLVDRAVKKNLIHKNKAARIKSGLSKLARTEKSAKDTKIKTETAKKLPKTSPSKKPSKKAK